MVTYLPELFYWQDMADFPFERAMRVTAVTIARWCTYYYARLIAPLNGRSARPRAGLLPPTERETFVAHLLDTIWQDSATPELFTLYLHQAPLPAHEAALFDHPDDTCCWSLHLSPAQFAELVAAWQAHNLPADLFYPAGREHIIPWPGQSLWARLWRRLGVTRVYTPRQWQAYHSPNKNSSPD